MTSDIAVIGAGIAGLAVAAQLQQSGVDCVVYEQAPAFDQLGAGIQISPNGSRLLHRLGLGPMLERSAIRPEAIQMLRWFSGEPLSRTDLGSACATTYGAPYYVLRRADLHAGLRGLVSRRIRAGRRCVVVCPEGDRVRVRFADGSSTVVGAVIGADGIHSVVRGHIPSGRHDTSTEINVYRGLVPARDQPERHRVPTVDIWLGPGQHCVSYPVPGWISFVASVPDDRRPWSGPGRVEDLLAAYGGWDSRVRRLLGAAALLTRWSLREGPPLDQWTEGRVTLLGDAAHAMVPVGAQGATQALEDAAVLAACVAADPGRVDAAFARYEAIRRPRIAQVAAAVRANMQDHHLADGPAQRRRDLALAGQQSLAAQRWLYGYDAEQEVRP